MTRFVTVYAYEFGIREDVEVVLDIDQVQFIVEHKWPRPCTASLIHLKPTQSHGMPSVVIAKGKPADIVATISA